jgi:hypothetical protein
MTQNEKRLKAFHSNSAKKSKKYDFQCILKYIFLSIFAYISV